MEFQEALRRRRMVRSYSSQPVERAAIERIAAAGLRAPSAGFSQGFRLVVVTSPSLRAEIAHLADESGWLAKGYRPWVGAAPVLIALGVSEPAYHARYHEQDKVGPDGEIEWPVPYWWVDGGAALMAVLLAAVDEGLVAGFLGIHALDELSRLLGLEDDVSLIGLITVGHPGPEAELVVGSATRPMRGVDEQVSWFE